MSKSRGLLVGVVILVIAILVWWTQRDGSGATTDDDPEVATGSSTTRRSPGTSTPKRAGQKIAGIVLRDGVPVAGATVSLIRGAATRAAHKVRTDAAGRFDLGEQPAERYSVVAEKAGSTPGIVFVDLRDVVAKPSPDQLRVALHACDAALHGTIRDVSGGPIAKARVGSLPGGQGIESGDDGTYEVCVPVGNGGVWVDADGYARARQYIAAYGRVRRDFELVPEAVVTGKVVEATDKTAVPGAHLTLIADHFGNSNDRTWETAIADEDGQFRIDGLLPGRYLVTAKAERRAMRQPAHVTAEVGAPGHVTCEVVPTLVIAGTLVQRGTTVPVAGARISMSSRELDHAGPSTAHSQADGSFEVEHLFPGTYRTWVADYTATETSIALGTEDKRDVVIEVESLPTLAGRVTYRGHPVDGAFVRGGDDSTTTDLDGAFLLRLEPGEHGIYAESKRLGAFATNKPVTLAKGAHRTGFDIELDLAGAIEGVVVDQNGKPVGGVALEFSLLTGRDFGQATTAEDGTFKVGALSGGGNYGFLVRSIDSSIKFSPVEGKRFPPIAVADGKTRVTGVRVAIRYERKVIAGRVVTTNGVPLPDVLVSAENARSSSAATTRTAADGTFTLRDLPEGAYNLRASGTRGVGVVDNVVAGRRDVLISVAATGSIVGTADGFPPQIWVIAYSPRARVRALVKDGAFELRNVPPGDYNVVVVAAGNDVRVEAKATVTEGGTTTIKLSAPGTGSVTGLVVDETGSPVANAPCNVGGSNATIADASGRFRIDAVVGAHRVICGHPEGRSYGNETLEVRLGQTVDVRVTLKVREARKKGISGFRTSYQLEEWLVVAVTPGGPADRAGLQVNDVVLKYNDDAASELEDIEYLGPGAVVRVTIERNDKQQVLTLTLGTP